MQIKSTPIEGCFIIKPTIYMDDRGSFFESFHQSKFQEATGLRINFVQDNQSQSRKGVLRGLHFQTGKHAQAKLVRVVHGAVLDVAVDVRQSSKTFGQHISVLLDDKNNEQLFIPRGFAHGFIVISETAVFNYKCDNYYCKTSESGIRYDDPDLEIDWNLPIEEITLSEKDRSLPFLQELF